MDKNIQMGAVERGTQTAVDDMGEAMPDIRTKHARYCYTCGARIPVGDAFCGKCGQPRRSEKGMEDARRAYSVLMLENALHEQRLQEGDPMAILAEQGVDAAFQAMTESFYTGRKKRISEDGAKLLLAVYAKYVLPFRELKRRSRDGKRVRAIGLQLNALEGWLGMIKAYELFKKENTLHQQNLADLWSGIGDWGV